MGNVHVFDIISIYFTRKEYSENLRSIQNTGNNLTMKRMFDISEKLIVAQSDEISGVTPSNWENLSWKQFPLVGDEEVISLSHAKVYVFSDSVLCLGKMHQNPQSNTVWEDKLTWFKSSSQYRALDTIDGEPKEFEWNIFTGFTTLQLVDKVQEFMNKMGDPAQLSSCRCSMTSFGGSTDNERECIANATHVSLFAKRFPAGRWSFLGPGSEKKWYSTHIDRPRGKCDRVAELMMIKFGESGHQFSEPRVHCPEERSKAKEVENYRYTSVPMVIRLKLFFEQLFPLISSISTEQSQICVRNTVPLAGQSDHLFEPAKLLITTPTPRLKFLHKRIYCKSTKIEWKGFHIKIVWFNFVLMQVSWKQLKSDST